MEDKQPEEEKEKFTVYTPKVVSQGCETHYLEEDYFDGRSGWVHTQCRNCDQGRYFAPLTHKLINGEIIEKSLTNV